MNPKIWGLISNSGVSSKRNSIFFLVGRFFLLVRKLLAPMRTFQTYCSTSPVRARGELKSHLAPCRVADR